MITPGQTAKMPQRYSSLRKHIITSQCPHVVSQRSVGVLFAAIQTGGAAEVAALSKESAWTAQTGARALAFVLVQQGGSPGLNPPAIEPDGPLTNARFHEFLQILAVASS